MKKLILINCLLTLLIISFQSCEKWNLDEENFITVELSALDVLSLNSVKGTGEIKGLEVGQVSDHGFLWTTEEKTPTLFDNEGILSLGIKDNGDAPSFSEELGGFIPDTRYTFVAFGILDGTAFYSDPMNWESGSGMVFTDSLNYSGGNSLLIFGRISGTEAGLIGTQHGFCWSPQNETPSLEDEFLDLGVQRSDLPFSTKIDSLENNITIYLRAFSVLRHPTNFSIETVYGEVFTFDGNLSDIWIQRNSISNSGIDPNSIGKAFSTLGNGYFQLGNEAPNFWEYDLQSDNWTQKATFNDLAMNSQAGFSINNKIYFGTGTSPAFLPTSDFWEYDPQTDTWAQKADFGGVARWLGVGFSIDDRGYIGLGGAGNLVYLKDLWEYNPQTDSWTQKVNFGGEGRDRAVAFTAGGKAYVGTGSNLFTLYKDFWEYDPQADSWNQIADFEGEARYLATGFSIHDKGYVGMGLKFGSEFGDFWEYDRQINSWNQINNIPTTDRLLSSFSTGDRGFVGKIDYWEYIPR